MAVMEAAKWSSLSPFRSAQTLSIGTIIESAQEENNCYFAFANALREGKNGGGLSGIFGPDTFPSPERKWLCRARGLGIMEIDLSGADSIYPTNVARRKDLVLMRQRITITHW